MRSKKKIEQQYNALRLRNNALNENLDELDVAKDFDYEQIAAEQQQAQDKLGTLAYVLGYSKHL